jgi:hypothetical protein
MDDDERAAGDRRRRRDDLEAVDLGCDREVADLTPSGDAHVRQVDGETLL